MAASSSLASRQWNYDVFLSFSGEDVRRTFLSHVLKEFQTKGIHTFEDSGIKRSNSIIVPELVRAIRESKIAIVILSKNYASLSWCLNELLEIMDCKVTGEQMVMTIFIDVDPSDVRKQTGDFGRIFEETCLGETEDVKLRWKQALTDVANILGEHSKNWDSEADMISKIATDVSNELNFTASTDFDNSVGIEARVSKMNSLLCLESDEIRMAGIWGACGYAVLPGSQVPGYFTHQARGHSLTVCLDQMHLSGSLRFKACIVLHAMDNPADVSLADVKIWCYLTGKHSIYEYEWPNNVVHRPPVDHLFIVNSFFTLEEDNIPQDKMSFTFRCYPCKILSCGVQFVEPCPCPYNPMVHPKLSSQAFRYDGNNFYGYSDMDDGTDHNSDMDYGTDDNDSDMNYRTGESEEVGETTIGKKRERPSHEEAAESLNKNMRSN